MTIILYRNKWLFLLFFFAYVSVLDDIKYLLNSFSYEEYNTSIIIWEYNLWRIAKTTLKMIYLLRFVIKISLLQQ